MPVSRRLVRDSMQNKPLLATSTKSKLNHDASNPKSVKEMVCSCQISTFLLGCLSGALIVGLSFMIRFTPCLLPHGHKMDWIGSIQADTSWLENGQESETKICSDQCLFTLVESIPQNLTFLPNETIHMPTYNALKTLMQSAKKSVHIASYYWTLRGEDIPYHDETAAEGEDVLNTLISLGEKGNISIKVAQNAENNDTLLLAQRAHAEVRTLNFTRLVGGGILHTKFWVVDGEHFYIGSANLDWRSLTQVKELGILVQNCPCLGANVENLFDVYFYLGAPHASIPASWPPNFSTDINVTRPVMVSFNQTQAPVFLSSSPPQFCPPGRTSDIHAILSVIKNAKRFIYISVMDYFPTTLYTSPERYWPVIDDALREAAFNRGILVRLMTSLWAHTIKDMHVYLTSLASLACARHPKNRIQLKMFKVPVYSPSQQNIPFSRVNHNKFMVTDQHAYIGTSNWSGDYFIVTGGVGFIVKQPENYSNATQGNIRQQLEDVFKRDWFSEYASLLEYNISHCHSLEG